MAGTFTPQAVPLWAVAPMTNDDSGPRESHVWMVIGWRHDANGEMRPVLVGEQADVLTHRGGAWNIEYRFTLEDARTTAKFLTDAEYAEWQDTIAAREETST